MNNISGVITLTVSSQLGCPPFLTKPASSPEQTFGPTATKVGFRENSKF
ncbi:MAG: hypothetical protein JKX71_08210 [Amylibacter sp.]|nr:hypothetical protein [Amylibacter sp.]